MKENTIPEIVEFIDQVIMNYNNEIKIKEIRKKVNKLMNNYQIFAY